MVRLFRIQTHEQQSEDSGTVHEENNGTNYEDIMGTWLVSLKTSHLSPKSFHILTPVISTWWQSSRQRSILIMFLMFAKGNDKHERRSLTTTSNNTEHKSGGCSIKEHAASEHELVITPKPVSRVFFSKHPPSQRQAVDLLNSDVLFPSIRRPSSNALDELDWGSHLKQAVEAPDSETVRSIIVERQTCET